jgi:PhnB protein
VTVDDASAAIAFWSKALGAEEIRRVAAPDGRVMHAEVRIEGSILMLNDPFPDNPAVKSPNAAGATTCVLHVYTRDVDALVKRAAAAGATVVMPPTDMFWGDRYAALADPFGHVWGIATRTEDLSEAEVGQRARAMFGGR